MIAEQDRTRPQVVPFTRADTDWTAGPFDRLNRLVLQHLRTVVALEALRRRGRMLHPFVGSFDWDDQVRLLGSVQKWHETMRDATRFVITFVDDFASTAVPAAEWSIDLLVEQTMGDLSGWLSSEHDLVTNVGTFSSFALRDAHTYAGSDTASSINAETNAEAERRSKDHESVVREVCRIAEELSARRDLRLTRIRVRPAWSHEYEETTGIVIQIELRGSSEDRFSYWEALGREVDTLAKTLPANESAFLDANVSLIVSRL